MKRRKKRYTYRSKTTKRGQSSPPRSIELEPEEMTNYLHLAEKETIPLIKEHQLPPGFAMFLLAQRTQVLITKNPYLTEESARTITAEALALWQEGYYTPGPDYPYTLEETLKDIAGENEAPQDYAESFRPFTPSKAEKPLGLGELAGGLVKHPETGLWQIWLRIDGPCVQIAAYADPEKAQRSLEIMLHASRQGGSDRKAQALYNDILSRSDGIPKQIPFKMMEYLIDHIDNYIIKL